MGRKARIDKSRFSAFIEAVPDDLTNSGYWKLALERSNPKTGGVLRSYLGHIPFEIDEDYDALRNRVKAEIAEKKGPGCYLAIPNDADKKDIKGEGMVRFTFKEREVGVVKKEEEEGMEDPMKSMTKMQNEMLKLKKMAISEKMMKKMLGEDDDDEPKEKESSPMDMLMMAKMLGGDDKKDGMDMVRMMEFMSNQNRQMMEMMRGQEPRGNDMADFLKMMETRRMEEETRRREEEHRREADRKEREHRMEVERKERERREEEERKEERHRWEEQMRMDRERYEKEAKEQRLRAEEEARLRREEMRLESEKNAQRMHEERDYQFRMMEVMQSKNEGSTKAQAELMGQITKGAMGSMNMATTAADAIMSIAQANAVPKEDKEEGLGDIIKGLAGAAGPLLGSMGGGRQTPALPQEAVEGLQLLQRVGGVQGLKRLISRSSTKPTSEQPKEELPAPKPEEGLQGGPEETQNSPEAEMIAQFVKANPYIKDAIVGNIQEGLGVAIFLPMLTEYDHPIINSVLFTLANTPVKKLQEIVLESCETDEERVTISGADEWFKEFKLALLDELSDDDDDDDDDEPEGDEGEPEGGEGDGEAQEGEVEAEVAEPEVKPEPKPEPVAKKKEGKGAVTAKAGGRKKK